MSETPKSPPIFNEMRDCGDGNHVGWWMERDWIDRSLLINVNPTTLSISACEGPRAETRIIFVVKREKGVEICRAMMKALGIVEAAS